MENEQSIYRKILRDALKVSWRYKYLWILGVFALLFSNIGVLRNLVQYGEYLGELNAPLSWQNFPIYLKSLFHLDFWLGLFNSSWVIATADLVLLGFIIGIFLWLGINAQLALLESVKYYLLKDKKKVEISHLMGKAQKKFWPALSINLIRQGLIVVIGGALGMPILLYLKNMEGFGTGIIYFLMILIFVLLLSIISFVTFYVYAYMVFYDKKFTEALKAAEKLFSKNWLVSLEMALFLFIIDILMTLLLNGLGLFIVLSVLWFVFIEDFMILVSLAILILLFSVLSLFLFAWLYNYQITAWSLLFLRLQEGNVKSKTRRLLGKLKRQK